MALHAVESWGIQEILNHNNAPINNILLETTNKYLNIKINQKKIVFIWFWKAVQFILIVSRNADVSIIKWLHTSTITCFCI